VLVVIEPRRELAQAALARTPDLYARGGVHVLAGPDYQGGDALWKVFDAADAVSPSAGLTPAIVVDPALAASSPAPVAKALRVVKRAIDAATMNARAREENAGRYLCNTLRNVAHAVHGPDPARLRDQFSTVPAIVVGAGPSLDAVIPTLRMLGGRAVIIATDTSWRPLAAAGIDPHLVVATDPTDANGRHLRGITSGRDTWVLSEGSVDPAALLALRGRVGIFRIAPHHPWPWLNGLGLDRGVVKAWGSVLTSAYDLASTAGCHPIVFVGADLSFTDGRPYCRGTSAEQEWAVHTARGASLRLVWKNTIEARALRLEADVNGGETPTAPHLIEFRNWLVAEASRQPAGRVINASGAGILMGSGVTQADLSTALAGCADRDAELRQTIARLLAPAHDTATASRVTEALRALEAQTRDTETGDPLIREWLRFGRPRLTVADIHAAAAAGCALLASPIDERPAVEATSVRAPKWHPADRTALMHAQLLDDDQELDGTVARPDRSAESRARAVADAASAADALAALPHLATKLGDHVLSGALPHKVPLSTRFEWVEEARPLVAVLEESLVELGVGSTHSVAPEWSGDDFWTGPIVPVQEEGRAPRQKDTQLDVAARRAVFWERLATDAREGADDLMRRRRARLESAIVRGFGHPWFATSPPELLRLRFPGCSSAMRLPLRVDVLMRALTGTLARAVPGVDSRHVLAADGAGYCEPRILTGAGGLTAGWSVVTCNESYALFTPKASSRSVLLDADGTPHEGSSWPAAILIEAPWGSEGGAIAWSSPSTLWFRPRAGAAAVRDDVPFVPRQLSVGPDRSACWLEVTGELWDWVPGGTRRFVLFAPGAGYVRHEGTDVVLAPVERTPKGVVIRRRAAHEWRCNGVPHVREEVAAAAEGQCNKVAPGRWTARSYPFSDLVRLERGDGAAWLLACHAAAGVAWAGSSLAVTTQDGELLFFPRLADRLDELDAGPGIAPFEAARCQ